LFLVVVAWLASLGISLLFINSLYRGQAAADADAAQIRSELELARTDLATYQAQAECTLHLSTVLQDKNVDNSVAFNRYVIGLAQLGDIAALQADLDAAGLALQTARDAYVAQVCPAGS
jgi:hypothetical protein